MVAASNPRIVCSMSGARTPGSIAGWEQTNIRRRRSSGIGASLALAASISSASHCSSIAPASAVRRFRTASINFRRAAVSSHASGLAGMPLAGHPASADANASDRASSAPATSRVRAARKEISLP